MLAVAQQRVHVQCSIEQQARRIFLVMDDHHVEQRYALLATQPRQGRATQQTVSSRMYESPPQQIH